MLASLEKKKAQMFSVFTFIFSTIHERIILRRSQFQANRCQLTNNFRVVYFPSPARLLAMGLTVSLKAIEKFSI